MRRPRCRTERIIQCGERQERENSRQDKRKKQVWFNVQTSRVVRPWQGEDETITSRWCARSYACAAGWAGTRPCGAHASQWGTYGDGGPIRTFCTSSPYSTLRNRGTAGREKGRLRRTKRGRLHRARAGPRRSGGPENGHYVSGAHNAAPRTRWGGKGCEMGRTA